MKLFSEVGNETKFSINIYSQSKESIEFDQLANLFLPSTVDIAISMMGQD